MTISFDTTGIARALGYLVATVLPLLYTPMIVRIVRQGSADGLSLSTFWMKLVAYSCTIIYFFDRGYELATFCEFDVLAVEVFVILVLVAYYQQKLVTPQFFGMLVVFLGGVGLALAFAPPEMLALGQTVAAIISAVALFPQFALNYRKKTTGDYSPVTLSLAVWGCIVRLFTTSVLASGDPYVLFTFGLAFVVDASLLIQILYYGTQYEKKTILAIMVSDVKTAAKDEGNFLSTNDTSDELVKMEEQRKLLNPFTRRQYYTEANDTDEQTLGLTSDDSSAEDRSTTSSQMQDKSEQEVAISYQYQQPSGNKLRTVHSGRLLTIHHGDVVGTIE